MPQGPGPKYLFPLFLPLRLDIGLPEESQQHVVSEFLQEQKILSSWDSSTTSSRWGMIINNLAK